MHGSGEGIEVKDSQINLNQLELFPIVWFPIHGMWRNLSSFGINLNVCTSKHFSVFYSNNKL